MEGATYFVSWSLHPEQTKLEPKERDLIMDALWHFDKTRYNLIAFVIMDNHIHIIFTPLGEYDVVSVIHSWKSFTANRLQRKFGRTGNVWMEEYYDRIIRDEDEFIQKGEYIIANPLKCWPEISEYKWLWHIGMDGQGRPSS